MLRSNFVVNSRVNWGFWVVLVPGVLLGQTGCSREHFRDRADKDVEAVISQKNIFPDWKVENWHVYPDSRARFADANPDMADYPPYPPDEYASWLTAPNPQQPGRGGTGRHEGDGWLKALCAWDAQNRAEDEVADQAEKAKTPPLSMPGPDGKPLEKKPQDQTKDEAMGAVVGGSSAYERTFLSNERGYRIRLDQAVELALFNSREFQDRREDLYLAALPVTLERFGFAAQAFAAERLIRQSVGREYPGGGGENWQIETDLGFNRTFATGAELIVRLANQIVIDLSGPAPQTSISNLGLTFIQPLLRGGGFAVTLEALTQAERTLLYAIRSYARFRKVFYVAIAGQGDYTNNPYGLQGLAANLGRGVGANLTARPVGYLPTVLRAATLANERMNMANLEQFLRLFRNLQEGGVQNELQVGRVEQNLINSRIQVLNSTRLYLDNIDNFKLQLGIPATVPMELDDTPLRPVRQQLQRYDQLFAEFRELEVVGGRYDANAPVTELRERWRKLLTNSSLVRGTTYAQEYEKTAALFRTMTDDDLTARQKELQSQRRLLLDERANRQLNNIPETPAQEVAIQNLEDNLDRIQFEQALRRYENRPWLGLPPGLQQSEQAILFRTAVESGLVVAARPRQERLDNIRAEWPKLPQICVEGVDLITAPLDESFARVAQAALLNRLDLMNSRAQVVDGWRQITVRANSLQGTFDVRYDLESTTPRDEANGLGFSGQRSRHTVTLRLEPPFVRRVERNQYRAALISYQRTRRNLMSFEDNIITDSRINLRQLRQLAEAYRLQQRAVELSYAQLDNARTTLTAPPDPAVRDTAAAQAALTEQLLNAQAALLRAQNDLFTTWVTYQTVRMNLFLDVELLPLDARGIWTDDPLSNCCPPEASLTEPEPGSDERVPASEPVPLPAPATGR